MHPDSSVPTPYSLLPTPMSNIRTEIIAGIVTFSTMAYAICEQPAILCGMRTGLTPTGMNFEALITTMCLTSAFFCFLMGFWARYPLVLASGIGMNFLLATSIMPACARTLGSSVGSENVWRLALGTAFVSGAIFVVLASLRMCSAMVNIISPSMKNAITVGLGMFIVFFGLKNGDLITIENNQLTVGNLLSPEAAVCIIGLIIGLVLTVRKIPGALLIAIIVSSIAAYKFHLISFDKGFIGMPADPRPVIGKIDAAGVFKHIKELWPSILLLAFLDIFGAFSAIVGILQGGGVCGSKGKGDIPRSERVFITDALGTIIGPCMGHSTFTTYLESASGVETGGRTGLTAVIAGVLFLLALPFTPFLATLGSCNPICAPSLIIVGLLMFRCVKDIDWNDVSEAAPAFITIVGMTYTHSITDGILMGLIVYPVVKLLSGKVRDVHPGLWILSATIFQLFRYPPVYEPQL